MANHCSITGTVRCAAGNAAQELYQFLAREKEEADRQNIGMYIGNTERYLFDPEIDVAGDTIRITGWVKWCFQDQDVIRFIRYLHQQAEVRSAEITYEECGCLLYGQYIFEDGFVTDYYLPSEFFPEYEDGKDDEFSLALEQALNENGAYREVGAVVLDQATGKEQRS